MSFLSELESLAADLEAEGHTLAGKAGLLFGTADKIIKGLASELTPVITNGDADLKALIAEAETNGGQIVTQAVTDIKSALAEIRTLLTPAAPSA